MSKEEVDKINNFQNQFNKYLTSFDDILTIAAEIYAIYFEVDHAVKNIKELKSFTFSCPANTPCRCLVKIKKPYLQRHHRQRHLQLSGCRCL